MNDDTNNKSPANRSIPARPSPSRPPIEWPKRVAQANTNDKATDFARGQLDRAYLRDGSQTAPKKLKSSPKVIQPAETKVVQTATNPQAGHTLKNEPYDWQQYHSAWQQYYHQYFYRYYAGWWQQNQQVATLPAQNAPQNSDTIFSANEPEQLSKRQQIANDIKTKIRTTVQKNAKKVQSSSHFKPLLMALSVASVFLLINYNQVLIGEFKQYVAPGNVVTTPVIVEPNAAASVGPNPKIIIPKIGVEAPVVYDEPKVDERSYQAALERGVVRLGNTANPGTIGNIVIGGHSSNNVFNPGKYKYVFVNLKRLEVGDILYLNFEGQRYTYKVTIANKIVAPSETNILAQTSTPTVTLFTCDPPGTNKNRLIVQAVQIDPSIDKAVKNQNAPTDANKVNPLPSVAPSLWDRLFNS
ncbi:sortase [Candidatus Nomurabacteria bacterium]|nr:sortase [Candidatus Nomurabacteria bacterium]